MNLKKTISSLICFFIAAPIVSGAALPSAIMKACEKSGISEYYTAVSTTAFNMVNAVVENIIGIDIEESAKQEAPPKQENQKSENQEVVLLNNFQNNFQFGVFAPIDFTGADVFLQVQSANTETKVLMRGWFFLLLTAILMCVRKKDADFMFYNADLSYKNT
jgi:hypothetical protein